MTDFDILITMDIHGTSIGTALSNYLSDSAYTVTYEPSSTHWVWIPIITQWERRRLVDWFDMMQNETVIILPILLPHTSCPTAFEARFTVEIENEGDELQPYFQRLKEHLSKGRQVLNKLNRLKADYQNFNRHLKKSPQNLNLIRYLKDLQQQITLTHTALISPKGVQESNQNAILIGIYNRLHRPSRINPSHIVGNPPHYAENALKGRDTEIIRAGNYLLDESAPKIVSILGQANIGKTALACHILHNLSAYNRTDKILYLTASDQEQPLTLERLFVMTGDAFGGAVREILNSVWQDKQMTLETRIDYLINQYINDRCLLVFDNLDEKLTATGQFMDHDLAQFIQQFLTRDHRAQILITSRRQLLVDDAYLGMTKIIPLSMGLCDGTAINLLHEFDKDGILGLRGVDPVIKADIIKRTQGYPRALGAVVGILANRPLMPISEVIDIISSVDDSRLIADWVQRAEQVLDADQRMLMQALAVFVEPVDETAIRYLLDPYLETTGIDIPSTLERLQRGGYVIQNRLTHKMSIHSCDKDYYYSLIQADHSDVEGMSAGERFFRQMNILPLETEDTIEDSFTCLNLEKRAADFYAHLRGDPPSDWESIEDLQPYLLEYEHRLRAEDYDTCFTMLITIYNLLKLSGFSSKIVEMILPLIANLSMSYKITCSNMLGMAYDDLGQYQEALDCHFSALPLTRLDDNLPAEVAHLSGIGLQYSNLGEYEQALEHYEQALDLSRNTDNRKQERSILNNMAVVYNSLGLKLEALSNYEESLDIARDIEDTQGIAATLANIGDAYGALGEIDKTINCYQEAIDLYTSIGDKLGHGITIGKMGNAAAMLGGYEDALKLLDVAVDIATHAGNPLWNVLHQVDIATIYAQMGDVDKGLDLLEGILPDAEIVGTPIVMNYVYSVLAGMLLYVGQFERACATSETAIQYASASNQHYEYALYGLILVRLERVQDAQEAFNQSLDHAAELLDNTPNLYSPKYSRGLALMGLACVTGDKSYADDAKQAYIEARDNCDAKGIVNREMKKLKLLTWDMDDESNSRFIDEFQDE